MKLGGASVHLQPQTMTVVKSFERAPRAGQTTTSQKSKVYPTRIFVRRAAP